MTSIRSLVYVLTLFFLMFSSGELMGQLMVTGNFQDQALETVIEELEKNYDLVFVYTQDLVKGQRISTRFKDLEIGEALDQILFHTPLHFERTNQRYFILRYRKEEEFIAPLKLCGKVTGNEEEPLAFANIFLPRLGLGTSADENGIFSWSIKALPEDTIEISYIGLQTKQSLVRELQACPEVQLQLSSFSMPAVVVQEYITKGIRQTNEGGGISLRPNEMNVVPGLTEADLLQMVELLPGIQSIDESATGLHIRGGTPDQNLILWDGIPVYNGGHFFGMISAFNPYIVEEVEVYRGDFGAEYGGRLAGVIDINSQEKTPEQVEVNMGINFTHADIAITLPHHKQKAALTLSARRAYTDILESPTYRKLSQRVFQRGKIDDTQNSIEEGEPINDELSFVFNDLNLKWNWQVDAKNQFTLSTFGIFDRLSFTLDELDDIYSSEDQLRFSNVGISTRWKRNWTESLKSKLTLAFTNLNNTYQSNFGNRTLSEWDFRYAQDNRVQDFSLHWQQEWQVNDQLGVQWGYEYTDLEVVRDWNFNEVIEKNSLDENNIHSFHLTFKPQQEQRHNWSLGLRWNFLSELQTSYWEPRFSWQYKGPKGWRLKVALGQHYQFLSQVVELNELELNQQLWILADAKEDVPIARARHSSLGSFWEWKDWQLEVEGYYKQLAGITSFSPIFLENFREEQYSEGTGRVAGIDVLLKKRWANYQTWLSYTFSRVFYTFEIFNNNEAFPAPHDRPHYLASTHQWELQNWNISLSWKFASGKTYTEANEILMEEDEVFPIYDFDQTNNFRLPVYHRLDLSFLYQLPSKKGRVKSTLGFSILNVYNRENILSRQYLAFYDDEEEDYFIETLDRPMLGITPNLVFRLAWQ